EVPEPSSLFWQRFSNDVRQRIDDDAARRWWTAWLKPVVVAPLSALAAAALVIAVAWAPRSHEAPPSVATANTPPAVADPGDALDSSDPMLLLVADLSAGIDL